MLLGILGAVAVGLIWATIAVIQSRVARSGRSISSFYAAGFSLAALISWVLFPDWSGGAVRATPLLAAVVLWVGLSGVGNGAGKALVIGAMRHGHKAVTLALSQATMLVPFLAGVVLWREQPSLAAWLGVALAGTGAVVLALHRRPGDPDEECDRLWLPLALLSFAIIGAGRTLFISSSHWGAGPALSLRTPVALTAAACIHLLLMLVRRIPYDTALLKLSALFAVLAVVGYEVMFAATDRLEGHGLSGLTFPVGVAVSIAAFSLYSRFVLGEPYNRRSLTGLALTVAGLVLMVLA
jgi:drug/metabolite transporter (DMT)-like permease